ncbi:PstC family ABC transporter permease [Desulfofustis glycolicus]|uniref:Phosphate ABC transporter membrane protein 1, PhoT family n=1 Tax=Desulfofustis glycolicus DSM 9705 TaxID=1121409 RepID=A0A1M5SZ46_9BACT|nr:ABC transporter permease subunit [Desulfofustis glycolicus]SHH43598.1 phosphate ABC transporter membrane protein 1, PhoT family [Desulfofustis glycolicus DSM 9705]
MSREDLLQKTILLCATVGSGTLVVGIFLLMLHLGWPLLISGQFFSLLLQEWRPADNLYGIYPMLLGSTVISLLALLIGLPISLGTAFATTVVAPPWLRSASLALIRYMAGIPTVVYGFVAVFFLVPFMREQITGGSGLNILSAALVLAILIAPTMVIFFVNGLSGVAKTYSLAVDALGGTPVQKLLYLLLPQAWPALTAGTVMGLGRAMGDTLISLMVAGNSIAVPGAVTDSARTLTAHIALVIAADFAGMEFMSIFSCGIVLYLFTVLFVSVIRLTSKTRND